jgi:hypothetical protein
MGSNMLIKILDKLLLDRLPLEGYRTIIIGYLSTTVPALLQIVTSNPTGLDFWLQVGMVLAGPLIQYFKAKSKV